MELLNSYDHTEEYNVNKNYKFWKDFGFLEALSFPFDYELAFLFHCATIYLKTGHKFESFNDKDILIEKLKIFHDYDSQNINKNIIDIKTLYYPCIRRIYAQNLESLESEKSINVYTLFHVLDKFFYGITDENLEKIREEIFPYYEVDMQAEFVAWFCLYYLRTYQSHKKHLIVESERPSSGFIKSEIKNNFNTWRNLERQKKMNYQQI